jgi:hypothetical protein
MPGGVVAVRRGGVAAPGRDRLARRCRGGALDAPAEPAGRLRRLAGRERPLERVDELLGRIPAVLRILRESAFEHRVNGR